MKLLILTAATIISSIQILNGQSDRNWINFRSSAISMCITPSHGVFLATRVGEVAVPDKQPGTWRELDPEEDKNHSIVPTIDNISFFNNDTGFVSGFILSEKDVYDMYYRTTDGGRHWEKMHFPDAGWADVVVHLNNGKAWASIAGSGHIDYSVDYGLTWERIPVPNPKERYASIFFNNQGEGLIGSLWNVIVYTNDNGRTWKNIPSPLSQHAYQKTNIDNRPEINKVAIFASYILVEQESQLFVSEKDSIHWQPLPYDGFIADNNTETLFFTKGKTLIKANHNLVPTESLQINSLPGLCNFNNGELAIWSNDQLTTVSDVGVISTSPLFSNEIKVKNPFIIGYNFREGSIGYMGGKLYTQKNFEGDWILKETLPFEVKNRPLRLVGLDSIIMTGPGDSLLYFNLKTGKITQTSGLALLKAQCEHLVQKVVFENGSYGCFHSYTNKVIYEREGGEFELTEDASTGTKHKIQLTGYPDNLQASVVDDFIRNLPAAISKPPTISTLGLDAQDYIQCRKDIKLFEKYVKGGKPTHEIEEKSFRMYQNDIDFDRLMSLTDSIGTIRPETMDSLLYNTSTIVSTTTNWTAIQFIFENGETLFIRNNYYEPNSLHFPWTIALLNGYNNSKNLTYVNQFINAVYPKFLDTGGHADIVELFVKYLYNQ